MGFQLGTNERTEGVYTKYMTEGKRICNNAENLNAKSITKKPRVKRGLWDNTERGELHHSHAAHTTHAAHAAHITGATSCRTTFFFRKISNHALSSQH